MTDETLLEAEEEVEKTVKVARNEPSGIRSGGANAAVLDVILIDYHGVPTPLQRLRTIMIPETHTVLITPFDRSVMASIDKALRESDLGVNPTDDSNLIHVVLPALTEERRRDYTKLAKNKAEEVCVAVREIRRKAKEALDKIKKDGGADEDDVRRAEEKPDGLTKHHVEQMDKVLGDEEKELLEV